MNIDFHQHSQRPNFKKKASVLLFLDFEKAFGRLDRPWREQCMAAVGFGAGTQRWVSLLHAGTTAGVSFLLFWWKRAYMSIDANNISDPKDS